MKESHSARITIEKIEDCLSLFGELDANAKIIEKHFSVQMLQRENEIKINGSETAVNKAKRVITTLLAMMNRGEKLTSQNIRYVISLVDEGSEEKAVELAGKGAICVTTRGRAVKPKTLGQEKYVKSIEKNTITLGVGPAGTGKTYLAVAMAVKAFKQGDVSRIILTRPAVEAGEKLGFLPGDLQQKIDPYLRPLYDALLDMLGKDALERYQGTTIEVAPLAYMRGRTLDDSFIILDEAQNATKEQMKMFLTRLGFNSKMVVNGDITQVDLADGKKSGLIEVMKVLKNIDDISQILLTEKDVVRHKLVQDIVKAYEKAYERGKKIARNSGFNAK